MANVHRCIVVPAAYQIFAQSLCVGLAGEAGAGMLTTGASTTGNEPATHYIAAGVISEEFAVLMDSSTSLYNACSQAQVSVTEQQCIDILAASDVSDDEPFAALARLNLVLVG